MASGTGAINHLINTDFPAIKINIRTNDNVPGDGNFRLAFRPDRDIWTEIEAKLSAIPDIKEDIGDANLHLLNKELILALSTDSRYREYLYFFPDQARVSSFKKTKAKSGRLEYPFGYGEATLLPQLYWSVAELRVHPMGGTDLSAWCFSLCTVGGRRTMFSLDTSGMTIPHASLRIGPASGPTNDKTSLANEFTLSLNLKKDRPLTLYNFVQALINPQPSDENDGVKRGVPMFYYVYKEANGSKATTAARFFVHTAMTVFYKMDMLQHDPAKDFAKYKTHVTRNGTFVATSPGLADYSMPLTPVAHLDWRSRIDTRRAWVEQVHLRVLAFRCLSYRESQRKRGAEERRSNDEVLWDHYPVHKGDKDFDDKLRRLEDIHVKKEEIDMCKAEGESVSDLWGEVGFGRLFPGFKDWK